MPMALEDYEALERLLKKFYTDENERMQAFVDRSSSDRGFAMRTQLVSDQLDKVLDVQDWVKGRITSLKYEQKPQ